MTIRDIAIAFGYEIDKKSEKKAEDSIKGLKDMAKKAFATIGATLSLVKLNALVEEFTDINNQLKSVVKETENFAEVQDKVLKSANDTRVSYSAMASYAKGLMNTQSKLFSSVESTLNFAELTTKALKAAGANEASIASINSGIQSAFTTGKVSAGTFQSIMQSCPDAVEYLSKTLGVSERQVKALGYAGAITSHQLYKAFSSNAAEIEKSYENVSLKVTEALTYMRNGFGLWLTQFNETLQITKTISKVMVRGFDVVLGVLKKVTAFAEKLNKKLGGAEKTLKLIAIVGASLYTAMNAGKILKFFKTIGSMLNAGSGKLLIIAAAIIAVALLVEDFINFIKGNDSVIGKLFESAGVDAEEMRKNFLDVFNTCKEIFLDVWKEIKGALGDAWEDIKPALKILLLTLGNLIVQILPVIAELIKKIVPVLAEIIKRILPVLVNLIAKLMPIITKLIEDVLPVILDLIEKILPVILQVIEAVLPVLIDLIDDIVPILETVFSLVAPLVEMLSDLLGNILVPLIGVLTTVADVLSGVFGGALSTVLEMAKPLLDILSGIVNVAGDLMGGVLGGVTDVVGGIVSGIGGAVGGIFDGIGSLFGLAEGGYIGANNPTPVVIGDNTQEGEIVSPISKMRNTVLDALNLFASSSLPTGAAGTLQSESVNRVFTQNVSITNTFNGGSAEQQKNGAKAMTKSANDATGIMARGFAYAR